MEINFLKLIKIILFTIVYLTVYPDTSFSENYSYDKSKMVDLITLSTVDKPPFALIIFHSKKPVLYKLQEGPDAERISNGLKDIYNTPREDLIRKIKDLGSVNYSETSALVLKVEKSSSTIGFIAFSNTNPPKAYPVSVDGKLSQIWDETAQKETLPMDGERREGGNREYYTKIVPKGDNEYPYAVWSYIESRHGCLVDLVR